MGEDLLSCVSDVDISISNSKVRKQDWKSFLKLLKAKSVPTDQELGMVLKNLSSDEQVMFASILLDIEAESPSMSSYQKKFLALGMCSMLRIKDFEGSVLDMATDIGMDDSAIRELEAKSRLLGVLENKQKYLMEHINKHQEIRSNNGGALDEILNDPDLLDFQLMVRKKGSNGTISDTLRTESIEDADYKVVDEVEENGE